MPRPPKNSDAEILGWIRKQLRNKGALPNPTKVSTEMSCDIDARARPLLQRFEVEEGPEVSRADGEALAFLAGFSSLKDAYAHLDTLQKTHVGALEDKELMARATLTYPTFKHWADVPADQAREMIADFEALPPAVAAWLDHLDHNAKARDYEESRVNDPTHSGPAERLLAYDRDETASEEFLNLVSRAEAERSNALNALDNAYVTGRRAGLNDSALSGLLDPGNPNITSARDMRDFDVPSTYADKLLAQRREIQTHLGRHTRDLEAANKIAEQLLAEQREQHDKDTQLLTEHFQKAQAIQAQHAKALNQPES